MAALSAVLAAGAASVAQTDPAGTFQRGLRAYQEGRYNDALMAFEEVYAVRPLPDVEYNIALVSRALGRYQAAIAAYERYLVHPGENPDPARLRTVRETVTTLRGLLARVIVRATPAQVTFTLDGRPAEPTDGALLVDPGEHVLELSSPDHHPERRPLRLTAGGIAELEVRLVPLDRVPRTEPEAPSLPAWFWVSGAVGLASAGVALGVGLNANNEARNYLRRCVDNEPEPDCASLRTQRQASLDTQALAVNVLWAVASLGVAVAGVGLVRWLASPSPRSARVGLRPSPGGLVLSW
ncbi:MAG: hypothetical protein HY909_03850 [Deltaproteobacteria bacterium]|nr:hypothetical protein [Deltaproteobacteria bacterium]